MCMTSLHTKSYILNKYWNTLASFFCFPSLEKNNVYFNLFQCFVYMRLYLATTICQKVTRNKRGKKLFQPRELLLVSNRSRRTHLKEHNIQNAQFVLTFLLSALSLPFWQNSVPRRAIKLLNGCKHQENTCSSLTRLTLYKVTKLDLPLCRT